MEVKVGNLAPCVDAVQLVSVCGVPEANASVGSSTTRGKKTALMRRPSDGLNCSSMLSQFQHRFLRLLVPDQ